MSYIPFIFTCEEEEAVRTLAYIFMQDGKPTEDYKQFLLEVALLLPYSEPDVVHTLRCILMRFEESVYVPVTGIISIHETDAGYDAYVELMRAVYGFHCPVLKVDHADISNTSIIHMMQMVEKGCMYMKCFRKNRVHKELMHRPLRM
jgi:hypothetical protein